MPIVGGSGMPVIGSGYGMGWNSEQRNAPGYTATPVPSAFTGGLLDLLQAARLTDLNTLRLAVENNRSMLEDTRKQLNGLIADMTNKGLLAP